MQIRVNTQITIVEQGQPNLSICVAGNGPAVQNAQQSRVQVQSTTLTLWAAADTAALVKTLSFFLLYADYEVDVELGVDQPSPNPPLVFTVRVEPGLPLTLLSPVVMPGGLGTTPKAITRLRVQESQGNPASVHFIVG